MFTNIIAKKVTYFIGKGREVSFIRQTTILTELINGIKQIKIFLSQNRWVNEYDESMKRYFNLYVKDETWRALPPNALELMAFGLLGVLLMLFNVNNTGVSANNLSVLGVYVYSFSKFIPSFKNISAKRMCYVGNLAIIENLYKFCYNNINSINDGNVPIKVFNDAIKFDKVNFSYPGRKNVLSNLNFEIIKGQTTAIVGKSGSGKTTIINLILRLFTPSNGKIIIDDINLKDISLDTWLSKIGYVAQDTFIFNANKRKYSFWSTRRRSQAVGSSQIGKCS